MAKDIKILYLEDNESDYESFTIFMTQVLETLGTPVFVRAMTPEDAYHRLTDSGGTYDIFLTDLLFPDPKNPRAGHRYSAHIAIRAAAKWDHLAIIGLSIAKKEIALIEEEFQNDGGHVYVDKNAIYDAPRLSPADVLARILPILKKKYLARRSPGPSLDWTEGESLQIDAVVETVGKNVLTNILCEIAPENVRFVPHYVAPGWSGAVVVRVDGFKDGASHPEAQVLLKLSRDRDKLNQELQRAPRRTDVDARVYVPYGEAGPITSDGWHAIVARFEAQALSLNEWLSQKVDVTAEDIERLLEELFLEGLTRQYKAGKQVDKSALELLMPNLRSKARILNGSSLLCDLIGKAVGADAIKWDVVDYFIRFGQVGGRPLVSIDKGTFMCVCHGDLHGRNILVTVPREPGPSPRAWLIDPAHRGERHWASDVAKLSADLWMSAWAGAVESHRWDQLHLWRKAVMSWVSGKGVKIPRDHYVNRNAFAALSWIRDNLSRLQGGTTYAKQWEFQAALAVEFLEASSYLETAAPKRCLSLLAAHDLLVFLESKLPKKSI